MLIKSFLPSWSLIALAPVVLLALTACNPQPDPSHSTIISAETGVPGGVTVEVHEVVATVTAIDAERRKVTLETLDGKKATVKIAPDVINFDQIRVGDKLKAKVVEELVVYLAEAVAPPSDGAVTTVSLAPKGAKPGGISVETVQITAKIAAIDLQKHKVTLEFPDGTNKTITARPDVDLAQRKIGESVVIRTTESVMISVTTP